MKQRHDSKTTCNLPSDVINAMAFSLSTSITRVSQATDRLLGGNHLSHCDLMKMRPRSGITFYPIKPPSIRDMTSVSTQQMWHKQSQPVCYGDQSHSHTSQSADSTAVLVKTQLAKPMLPANRSFAALSPIVHTSGSVKSVASITVSMLMLKRCGRIDTVVSKHTSFRECQIKFTSINNILKARSQT